MCFKPVFHDPTQPADGSIVKHLREHISTIKAAIRIEFNGRSAQLAIRSWVHSVCPKGVNHD